VAWWLAWWLAGGPDVDVDLVAQLLVVACLVVHVDRADLADGGRVADDRVMVLWRRWPPIGGRPRYGISAASVPTGWWS